MTTAPQDVAAQEKPKNNFFWLNAGTNTVSVLIFAYLIMVLGSFYGIMYPTFPDIDPRTHQYLPKFNNRISEGDALSVRLLKTTNGKDRVTIANFTYRYTFEDAKPFKMPWNVTFDPQKKGRVDKLLLEVTHPKSGHTLQASEEVVKRSPRSSKKLKHRLFSGEVCLPEPEAMDKSNNTLRGYPQLQTRLIFDDTAYPAGFANGPYWPRVAFDHSWVIEDELIKLKPEGKTDWQIEVRFELVSIARQRFQQHMSQAIKTADEFMGESEDAGQLTELLAQSDSYIFIVTMVVSIFHMLFEVLAFHHEVVFFKSCEERDMAYISVHSILGAAVMDFIIAVYLYDDGASYLVLIFTVLSIFLELWKVTKVTNIKWYTIAGVSVPWVQSKARQDDSAEQEDDFDTKAMKWLMVIMTPVIVGYGVYSLMRECHKGWRSYFIKVLASCCYGCGFVLMTPQIFINYKYKTVAYLPWKKFIYKALNTFIDDLFAFIIRMPNMHRLSCFRDDIVFFIYLYQRWYYKVDKSRQFDDNGVRMSDTNDGDAQVQTVEASTEPKKER